MDKWVDKYEKLVKSEYLNSTERWVAKEIVSVLSKVDRGLLNLNATAIEYKNKAQEFLEKGDIAKAMQNRTVANILLSI